MQLKPLDPRFAKLVALWRSTTHEAENAAARAKAVEVAKKSGLTFERALVQLDYEQARAAHPNNPFAGFDEYQELTNPGHLAKRAAERAERRRIWNEKRAAVLARYGSADAALAPCEREKLILAAIEPWRKTEVQAQRWTESIDGWSSIYDDKGMPPHVRQAIATAYPLPTTFREAKAEADYWDARNSEMDHAQSEDGGFGDYALDKATMVRWYMVRHLAERDLPIDNLPDLVERFRMYRAGGGDDVKTQDALLRDLEGIAASPWRPISTAPRTADDVLVFAIDPVYNDEYDQIGMVRHMCVSSSVDRPDRRGFRHRNGPNATHWMPLPEPPPPEPDDEGSI